MQTDLCWSQGSHKQPCNEIGEDRSIQGSDAPLTYHSSFWTLWTLQALHLYIIFFPHTSFSRQTRINREPQQCCSGQHHHCSCGCLPGRAFSSHHRLELLCSLCGASRRQPFSLGQKFPSLAAPQTRLSLPYEPDIKLTKVPNALFSSFCLQKGLFF